MYLLIQEQMLHKNSWQQGRVVSMGQERQRKYVLLFCFKASALKSYLQNKHLSQSYPASSTQASTETVCYLSVTVKNTSMKT